MNNRTDIDTVNDADRDPETLFALRVEDIIEAAQALVDMGLTPHRLVVWDPSALDNLPLAPEQSARDDAPTIYDLPAPADTLIVEVDETLPQTALAMVYAQEDGGPAVFKRIPYPMVDSAIERAPLEEEARVEELAETDAREQGAAAHDNLIQLGSSTRYAYSKPGPHILETFPNPLPDTASCAAIIDIVAPEFTSLCPKTGQPDFATLVIEYRARDVCIESKSLKLYLGAFRNEGMFHEACVAMIFRDLWSVLKPRYLKVQGQFTPRGGIKFWPSLADWAEDEE